MQGKRHCSLADWPTVAVARLVIIALVAASFLVVDAAEAAPKKAAIVIDARTGRVLHAVNAEAERYPASLTKVMTLYMVFDAIDNRELSWSTKMRVSRRAARQPQTKLGLRPGQRIRVKDAVLSLVTRSANDAATVIAEHLAGTESQFAREMTAEARRLGMANTTFRNASGLPDRRQVTTARDMALLARALLRRFPHHYNMFATEKFAYRGATYKNHNTLLGAFNGADGVKTGYIRASGYNLMASARRGQRRLIGVIFGSRSSHERGLEMAALLEAGFSGQTITRLADAGVSSWAVQVGAFDERDRAERAGHLALAAAGAVFDGASVEVTRRTGGGLTAYYVARIAGLDRRSADRGCKRLQDERLECFVRRHAQLKPVALPPHLDFAAIGAPVPRPPRGITPELLAASARPYTAWGVQVGAFPAYNSAVRSAKKAVKIAPQVLSHGQIAVVPTKRRNRALLYRARIVGVDRQQANRACATLEARNMDCLAFRM